MTRSAVRPAVSDLTGEGAVYADGIRESFDVVVAATGFTTGLERLLGSSPTLDARGLPRPAAAGPGLFFAGCDETPRGQLYESNRGSAPRICAAALPCASRRAVRAGRSP